tara:strand:- start:2899 stop:3924 length:1026 start_codon:yes stop_codon:yes gene_type:complete
MSNIIDKIKKKIPLDQYIDLCLYKNKHSYYEKNKIFGPRGDFVTSPYVSSIFGEVISIHILNYFLSRGITKCNLLEIGAGEGVMAKDIIKTLHKFKNIKFRYFILEKSKNLIKLQKKNLNKFNVKWVDNLKNFNKDNLFILSNELLDSFPVKHLKKMHNKWYEKYIFLDGRKKIKSKYLRINKIPNNVLNFCNKNVNFIEYSPEIFNFLKNISRLIKKYKDNCFMTIDYGYSDDYFKDTLQALKKHKKVSIYDDPGNSDITYLVNFKLLNAIFKRNSLPNILNMTQSKFLINNGILLRLENAKKNLINQKNRTKLEMAVNRLIDPKQMGTLFKVLTVTNEN